MDDRKPEASSIEVRADLQDALARARWHLAGPGTWWTGEERLKIAQETRAAPNCPLCRRRKEALSPYSVEGRHQSATDLPDVVVEVVHRVRTDAGRLTEKWMNGILAQDLSDAHYVEIVAVVATVTALDTFNRAIGLPPDPLPDAIGGEPSRRRPRGAKRRIAWVPTLAPEDIEPGDIDPFARFGAFNIQKALSLVQGEVIGFFDLDIALYLPQDAIRDFDRDLRALSHPQMELIAAKASALNGCYY